MISPRRKLMLELQLAKDAGLLTQEEEFRLWECLNRIKYENKSYAEMYVPTRVMLLEFMENKVEKK